MKAPEKLYLRKRNKLPLEVVRNEWYETNPRCVYGYVEYIRTDALIEKAIEWFRTLDDKEPHYKTTEEFIEGFKKAMML